VAKPLHLLTKKGEARIWTEDEHKAFKELKFTSAPILVQPDQAMQFQLEMDTSRYATSPILYQLCEDEKWHPIGLTSKSLLSAERNCKSMIRNSCQSCKVWKIGGTS